MYNKKHNGTQYIISSLYFKCVQIMGNFVIINYNINSRFHIRFKQTGSCLFSVISLFCKRQSSPDRQSCSDRGLSSSDFRSPETLRRPSWKLADNSPSSLCSQHMIELNITISSESQFLFGRENILSFAGLDSGKKLYSSCLYSRHWYPQILP